MAIVVHARKSSLSKEDDLFGIESEVAVLFEKCVKESQRGRKGYSRVFHGESSDWS